MEFEKDYDGWGSQAVKGHPVYKTAEQHFYPMFVWSGPLSYRLRRGEFVACRMRNAAAPWHIMLVSYLQGLNPYLSTHIMHACQCICMDNTESLSRRSNTTLILF
jgi:hypothetical protein